MKSENECSEPPPNCRHRRRSRHAPPLRQPEHARTAYEHARDEDGREALVLRAYNFVAPIEDAGEPVTAAPDATGKAR